MILSSCTQNDAGPGTNGAHAMISFAEGGIRFALHSSSLVSVFQMLMSSTWSSLCAVPAVRIYDPPTAPTEVKSYTLQGLIAWKDIFRFLETQHPSAGSVEGSIIRKTCTVHPAHLLFRQVLFSVVQQLLTPHPRLSTLDGPALATISTPFKQAKKTTVPHIVVTPPQFVPDHQPSANTVPTPQDAAFGNQLTVPDPEFTVINCWKCPEYDFPVPFDVDEFGSVSEDPFAGFGGCASPSWGDPEDIKEVTTRSESWGEREEDDAGALGLGPTWSG